MRQFSAHGKTVISRSGLLAWTASLVCWMLVVLFNPAAVLGQTPPAPQQSSVLAAAQGTSIAVHVKSPLGANVAAAAVTLLPIPTGAALSQDTDDDGTTVFAALRPGQYRVLITKQGFIELSQDVRLAANARQDFEVSLQASFSDAVTVIGAAVNIENELNGRATLPEIVGTTLYAGKKSDVLVLDQMDANYTTGNQRQVFAKIPGTQIWEHDSSGLQIGISNRGLDPNQSWETNQRMNSYDIMAEVFAYPDTYFSPPLDAVERIEMVRGSASLQYGAQFGGLVNYQIRRAPADRQFTLSSTQSGGSNGFFSSHNQIGGKVGKVDYNSYYHRRQGNGWRRANNEFDNNSGFAQIEIDATDKLKIGFEMTGLDTLIHMGGGLTDAQFQEDHRQSNFPGNWFSVKWLVPSVKLEYEINPSTRLSFISAFIEGHRQVMWSAAQLATPTVAFVPWNPDTPRQYFDDHFHNSSNELRVARIHNFLGNGSALVAGFRYYHSKMSRLHGWAPPGVDSNFRWHFPERRQEPPQQNGQHGALRGERVSLLGEADCHTRLPVRARRVDRFGASHRRRPRANPDASDGRCRRDVPRDPGHDHLRQHHASVPPGASQRQLASGLESCRRSRSQGHDGLRGRCTGSRGRSGGRCRSMSEVSTSGTPIGSEG